MFQRCFSAPATLQALLQVRQQSSGCKLGATERLGSVCTAVLVTRATEQRRFSTCCVVWRMNCQASTLTVCSGMSQSCGGA